MDPYENLAFEEALVHRGQKDEMILCLWQNRDTIVIGRNQDVFAECKSQEFLETGGKIARRRSGGGAVYHDMGNLNFSIICSEKHKELFDYKELLKNALAHYGISAVYNGRNDILVEGKKISGNAEYCDGGICCQHGTILIKSDFKKMSYFLTPDKSKLQRNRVSSVASRVMNLSDIDRRIDVPSMMQSLIDVLEAEELSELPMKDDVEYYKRLYSNENWIFGGIR